MFILWTIPENAAGQYSCGFLWPWDCFILSEGLEHVKWLKPALGSWAFLRMSSINCLWSSMLKGKPNNFGTPKSVYSVLSLGTCLTGFQIVFKESSVLEILQIVAFKWCTKIMAKSWQHIFHDASKPRQLEKHPGGISPEHRVVDIQQIAATS